MFLGPLFKGQLLCGFGAIGKWGVKRLGCPWFHPRGKRRKALHGFGASGAKNGRVGGRRVWVGYGEKKGG